MKLLILSDIHGNYQAIKAMYESKWFMQADRIVLLGDIIDYGPNSNEIIEFLRPLQKKILCNIWGNHEYAIINDEYSRFSSDRGKASAKYTREHLKIESWNYIKNVMHNNGKSEFWINEKRYLAVHGSIEDEYWKAIYPDDTLLEYQEYDYVFSGHSHLPHFFTKYYEVDNPITRNRKKTVFINPGSIGQPRNLNPETQFAILDTETEEVIMAAVPYCIEKEQEDFSNKIDVFYKKRLEYGI